MSDEKQGAYRKAGLFLIQQPIRTGVFSPHYSKWQSGISVVPVLRLFIGRGNWQLPLRASPIKRMRRPQLRQLPIDLWILLNQFTRSHNLKAAFGIDRRCQFSQRPFTQIKFRTLSQPGRVAQRLKILWQPVDVLRRQSQFRSRVAGRVQPPCHPVIT